MIIGNPTLERFTYYTRISWETKYRGTIDISKVVENDSDTI